MTTYATIPAQDLNNAYFSTLQEFSSYVEDQTFHERPALERLTRNKKMKTGGRDQVEIRVRAGRNTNAKQIKSDADSVDFSEMNVGTVARLPMVMAAVPVLHSELSQSKNSGENQIVDLVKETMMQASETLGDLLAEQLFGDGSDSTMTGLDAIAPTTAGSNTYAGLSEATHDFWVPYYATGIGSYAANGYLGSTDDKMTRAFLACSDSGKKTPTYLLSDQLSWEYHHRALGQFVRYTSNDTFGKIGSLTLPFFNAEWDFDLEAPSGSVYLLRPDLFEWWIDPNFNYRWIPVSMGKQFLLSGEVLTLRYQIAVRRRNVMGKVSGITA